MSAELKPSIGFVHGEKITPNMINEAIALLRQAKCLEVLFLLGATHIEPAILTGTVDGQELPSTVKIMDTPWPPGTSLASTILHGATHLEQQRHPWGGLGLEVMAHTVELMFHLLLGQSMTDPNNYQLKVILAKLEDYLDHIYEDELDALGLVK